MLATLEQLDKWPDPVKEAQRGWIGRSQGYRTNFEVRSVQGTTGSIEVFTTRIDTIHGVSFLAISHENL